VHSLLLGCSAAVQAARLGIHPGSSAGTDPPQMSQRLARHCLRQVLGCVSICAAFHSRTSLSQPDIVIAMLMYNWVSRCTHAEVNTSRVSSHENRGVSAESITSEAQAMHLASLQSMVMQDLHALKDLTAFTELHNPAAALMMYASAMEEYKDEAYVGILIMAQACNNVFSDGMPWYRTLTHWRI